MRRIISTVILALLLSVGLADAQTYPTKTIKLIVPFVPGGPVDSLGRVVVQHLEGRSGRPSSSRTGRVEAPRLAPRRWQRPRRTATHCC